MPLGSSNTAVRICFTGPMVGTHNVSPNPIEELAPYIERAGISACLASAIRNPYVRYAHILGTIIAERRRCTLLCMQMYSSRSFRVDSLVARFAQALGYQVILVLHGGNFPALIRREPGRVKRVLQRAERIVTPSRFLADAVGTIGIDATVIPNVIPVDVYSFHRRELARPRLLWMRTLHPTYAPEVALRVLAGVRAGGIDASLTMAGADGGELGRLKALARSLNLDEFIGFVGFLDRVGKKDAFDAHDIFLNTSTIDNTPTSLLEAASAGMIIISSSVGGIRYLFDSEKNAILVSSPDEAGLATAVRRVVEDPKLAKRLSAGGHTLSSSFRPEVVVPEWLRLFHEVHRDAAFGAP